MDTHNNIDEQIASNNWVISGKHTKSGKPLLSADPHLGNSIPSFWTISHLSYGDKYLLGGTNPGVPLVLIGRTQHLAWGISASLSDVSDLYVEDIKNDKYKVDGLSRPLKKEKHIIKVKGSEPIDFEVSYTHRGPVISSDTLRNAQVLFGS